MQFSIKLAVLMENDILSKTQLMKMIQKHPINFCSILSANKYKTLYGSTFEYINTNYNGDKFSEKIYKHIYGEQFCKQCKKPLTSDRYRSFFRGYNGGFCSEKCMYLHPQRVENIKKTKFKKYGDSSYNNLPKQKATMLDRYGAEHNWCRNSSVREKCYQTNLIKNGSRTWNNHQKFSETMMERYGVKYPSQYDDFIEKIFKCRWKLYTTPSGKQIKIQGYENFALDDLYQKFEEHNIITNRRLMPRIFWEDDCKKTHRYYPDIFIKSERKFIEVKSLYMWKLHEQLNISKMKAAKDKGFQIEVVIYNSSGKLIKKYD